MPPSRWHDCSGIPGIGASTFEARAFLLAQLLVKGCGLQLLSPMSGAPDRSASTQIGKRFQIEVGIGPSGGVERAERDHTVGRHAEVGRCEDASRPDVDIDHRRPRRVTDRRRLDDEALGFERARHRAEIEDMLPASLRAQRMPPADRLNLIQADSVSAGTTIVVSAMFQHGPSLAGHIWGNFPARRSS